MLVLVLFFWKGLVVMMNLPDYWIVLYQMLEFMAVITQVMQA